MRASKDLPLDLAHGEFIGLAKLTRTGARRLWEEIDGLIRAGNVTAYLPEAFERVQRAACRSVPSSPLAAPGVTTKFSAISRPRGEGLSSHSRRSGNGSHRGNYRPRACYCPTRRHSQVTLGH
jgi:hypothetical protein